MIDYVSNKFVSIENRFPITPYIYSIFGNSCVGFMQCFAKLLGNTFSGAYTLYIRATLLIIMNTYVINAMGGPVYIKKDNGNNQSI